MGKGKSMSYGSGSVVGGASGQPTLKDLEGSEKQIAWATDIRNKYVERLNKFNELSRKKDRTTSEKSDMDAMAYLLTGKSVVSIQHASRDKIQLEKERYKADTESFRKKHNIEGPVVRKNLSESQKAEYSRLSKKHREAQDKIVRQYVVSYAGKKLNETKAATWIDWNMH